MALKSNPDMGTNIMKLWTSGSHPTILEAQNWDGIDVFLINFAIYQESFGVATN